MLNYRDEGVNMEKQDTRPGVNCLETYCWPDTPLPRLVPAPLWKASWAAVGRPSTTIKADTTANNTRQQVSGTANVLPASVLPVYDHKNSAPISCQTKHARGVLCLCCLCEGIQTSATTHHHLSAPPPPANKTEPGTVQPSSSDWSRHTHAPGWFYWPSIPRKDAHSMDLQAT